MARSRSPRGGAPVAAEPDDPFADPFVAAAGPRIAPIRRSPKPAEVDPFADLPPTPLAPSVKRHTPGDAFGRDLTLPCVVVERDWYGRIGVCVLTVAGREDIQRFGAREDLRAMAAAERVAGDRDLVLVDLVLATEIVALIEATIQAARTSVSQAGGSE